MRVLNVVLFGPPGAGKGTQAQKLVAKYGIKHISTGQAIRDEIGAKTELGLQVEDFISKGSLAPDELVISIIEHYLETHHDNSGTIFDGFPRTTIQAVEFDKILAKRSESVTLMLSLDVPDQELVKRLLLRGKESHRADDSNEQVIKNRIAIYKAQTEIVAEYYKAQGKYYAVDGIGTMDEVFDRLSEVMDRFTNK